MRSPLRLRRALLRGKPATYWLYRQDNFVIRGSRPGEETDVPVSHLADPDRMEEHFLRLSDKRWIPPAAIAELRAMADGVRT